MNYLRGAFNAASQYYKDLPPINPSTLTGAIDVIVIERPSKSGGTELVCSPFHVRFGKWQVLRPAEKKVKVLVNGHGIPFDMKVGDAGEAFFVLETDEDLPEELMTSPLLQPTTEVPAELPREPVAGLDGLPQEPDFLDLNSPQLVTKPGFDNTRTDAVMNQPQERESLPKSLESKAATLTSELSYIYDAGGRDSCEIKIDIDVGDSLLPHVDEREAQPPAVTYHQDVVLDVSGYHSKEVSEETVLSAIPHTHFKSHKSASLNLPLASNSSRPSSPESNSSSSVLHTSRAASEPPEYGASTSPPPDYSWDWGAVPRRPSSRQPSSPQNYSNEDLNLPQPSGIMSKQRAPSRPRSRSPIPDGDGGILEEDEEDPYKVWLEFEGQRFGFELSLCGDNVRNEEAEEACRRFENRRVTFKQLLDDAGIVHSSELVVRWDGEYIYRSDDSPLMPALVNWRRRSLSSPVPSVSKIMEDPSRISVTSPQPRPSTWLRWWSRSRNAPNIKHSSAISAKPLATIANAQVGDLVDRSAALPVDNTVSSDLQHSSRDATVPFPTVPTVNAGKKFAKTLRLTSDQLKALDLKKGMNRITFSLSMSGQVACTARIFLWDASDQIVVSDIDGTITKSDALGHVFTMIGRDWTHLGVAKLYADIYRNGYKIMYLTSRAIGQADSTRDYLRGINQNSFRLPEGPVIMSPDRLLTSLHREVIMRKPEVFKMACLRDIRRLFGTSTDNPFYGGFGNRITDALSYRSVDIPSAKIFTIDSSGEVKMELMELAGYKSSYIHMTDLVDQMFPPINRKCDQEYTDFNYWRAPMAEYKLPDALTSPPSPSLSASARSDTSAFTRLRQFSLRGASGSRAQSPEGSLSSSPGRDRFGKTHQTGSLRGTSVDGLGTFLSPGDNIEYFNAGGKRRVERAGGMDDVYLAPGELTIDDDGGRRYRIKNRPESMPGSLDRSVGMHDPRWARDRERAEEEEDGEGEEEEEGDDDGDFEEDAEYAEEAAEEAFDDDLLATGEMESVPFL